MSFQIYNKKHLGEVINMFEKLFKSTKLEEPKQQPYPNTNKVLICQDLSFKREPDMLYYVSFKQGYFQVYKTKMNHGRKKKI